MRYPSFGMTPEGGDARGSMEDKWPMGGRYAMIRRIKEALAVRRGDEDAQTFQLLKNTSGSLMLQKLRQLFVVMLANNFFVMIMLNVDSAVVGWKIGQDAVASVNYLQPFDLVIGALVALFSNGIATLMSKQLGEYDPDVTERKKKAVLLITLLATIVLSVIQVPICVLLFGIYNIEAPVLEMAWRYAIVSMLYTPFSIMNTIGTYLLTSLGHAKTILKASMLQGVANAAMDVLFVFGLGLSTEGVGLGNLIAGLAFFVYVVHSLKKNTSILTIDWSASCRKEMVDIVRYGTASLVSFLSAALFNIIFFWFITQRVSDAGVAFHSVCLFAGTLVTVLSDSLYDALNPLAGMLSTIGDRVGMHRLLRQALVLGLALGGTFTAFVWLFPWVFFRAYGFAEATAMGVAVLRCYALHFVLGGINVLMRMYFNTWDDLKYASLLASLNNIVLPSVFSAIFFLLGAPYTIWLSFAVTDLVCFVMAWTHYRHGYHARQAHAAPVEFNCIIHPDEAPVAAGQLQDLLLENGIASSLANRVAICVEEIGAYALPAKRNGQVTIQLYACITNGEATVVMLDDGQCVALPEPDQQARLTLGNYDVLRSIANNATYDYVLDLNRFTVKLQGKEEGLASPA